MACAQQGDREAYTQLMGELVPAIEGFVRARFGSLPFVEDCVQESLLSIHRSRASYDPKRPFRPWLFAIVRRRMIDGLRSNTRRRHETPLEATDPPSRSEDPVRAMDTAAILRQLTPIQSQALVMTKLYGHSIADAARQAGVSQTAMKVRVHRAISAAKRVLEQEAHGPRSPAPELVQERRP